MQRDEKEKQLDATLESLIQRVSDVKSAINELLLKLDTGQQATTWPTVLNSFALISSQINSLSKALRNERTNPIRSSIIIPLLLSPQVDPDLERLTEGRVRAFNHEVVPNYLRTKPEPELEDKEKRLETKTATSSRQDQIPKQIATLNKIVNNASDSIENFKEQLEGSTESRAGNQPSNVREETEVLIAAISTGRGLRRETVAPPSASATSIPQQRPAANPTRPTPRVKVQTTVQTAAGSVPYTPRP